MHRILSYFLAYIVVSLLTVTGFAQSRKVGSFVPEWVKDVVFYQIFPERFANGDPTNDPPGAEPWGGTPKRDNYFGGDLQGIIDNLNYLQRLGITALYLNPVNESSTNHKYHPKDYFKVDPHFGNEATFRKLIAECQARGIGLIIDGVFNHTGVDFFAFEDIKKNEKKSRYLHWYNVHSFPVGPPDKPNYECWWGLGDLPKLMTDQAEVREHLFEATKYWMGLGIDGWRLDVPNEMSHDFWIQWRKLVKSINPNAYIVGEIWHDATSWLQGDQFDAVMNYRFRDAAIEFFVFNKLKVSEFDSLLALPRTQYPREVNYALQNLVGSHDTERYLTLAKGDVNTVKLTALMKMTYVGAPMIYYGDEIGMIGEKDPGCRGTMIWDTTKWNMDLFRWFQKLIGIRNAYPVFRRGSFEAIHVDNAKKLYGFKRTYEADKVIVVLNNDKRTHDVTIPVGAESEGRWVDLLTEKTFQRRGETLTRVAVPARSGVILMPVEEQE